MALHDPQFALVFGLLGNAVSLLVYLAPLPTFYRIYKRKSTEEFQSIPYSVALFSAMLTLYYATLKTDALMLVTINCTGCVIESIYLIIYLIYAPRSTKMYTLKLFMLFNFGLYALIVLLTSLFSHGSRRTNVVGWICAVFSSPNILGLVFGIAQMMLYFIYRNKRNEIVLPETQSQAELASAGDQRNKDDETKENSNAYGSNQVEETV
ncbi:unnamed protein product [Dovyalis caffra]|uniref:Bidirectional sugar transporter SWEET n=1 Tax=Dovyalis caffra TaxID=77055 RepID=A0AAV1SD68_9ROSI|nr:unnamed protein product [Dovyalis caffra]